MILLLVTGSFLHTPAGEDTGLLRFPDINGNLVAFMYAGDIRTVDAHEGDARQLTSQEGTWKARWHTLPGSIGRHINECHTG